MIALADAVLVLPGAPPAPSLLRRLQGLWAGAAQAAVLPRALPEESLQQRLAVLTGALLLFAACCALGTFLSGHALPGLCSLFTRSSMLLMQSVLCAQWGVAEAPPPMLLALRAAGVSGVQQPEHHGTQGLPYMRWLQSVRRPSSSALRPSLAALKTPPCLPVRLPPEHSLPAVP